MLQSIIDDLSGTEQESVTDKKSVDAEQKNQDLAIAESVAKTGRAEQEENNEQVKTLILKIQSTFAHRIERILASGGGLLVVVNQADQNDDAMAQELSETELPVVVIEAKTLSNLQRLGAVSPIAETKTIYEAEENLQDTVNPLLKVALDKLRSAEVLLEQECYAGVMEILATTLLTVATVASGQKQIPTLEKATVWLYSNVLPQQLMTAEQISTIVRVISLSQNIEVPNKLIEQSLLDTQAIVAQFG
jgi:hypothetical protein